MTDKAAALAAALEGKSFRYRVGFALGRRLWYGAAPDWIIDVLADIETKLGTLSHSFKQGAAQGHDWALLND